MLAASGALVANATTAPEDSFAPTVAAQDAIEPAFTVTGWPDGVLHAGESFTLTLHVDPEVLGAPSVEGDFVGVGFGSEVLELAQLGADGTASVTVRPVTTGPLAITPFFQGNEETGLSPVVGETTTVTVDPVPTVIDFWLEADGDTAVPTVYGGGELTVNMMIESECSAWSAGDEAAVAECGSVYGIPAGTLLLMQNGEVVAEEPVQGSISEGSFRAAGEDLSAGVDADALVTVSIPVPDILLGSPDSIEYSVAFDPDNWFGSSLGEAQEARLSASPTDVTVYVGDDALIDPAHYVNGESAELIAIVDQDAWWAAELSGTVTFQADGVDISEPLPLLEGDGVLFDWAPERGGEYVITADFTPETLNHEASTSEPYELTFADAPAPDPNPNEDGDGADGSDKGDQPRTGASDNANKLPQTGTGIPVAALLGALLLTILGGTALLSRRFVRQ